MADPRIPTPAEIRAMPVDSLRALRAALTDAGLHVRPGGSHLRVTTATGVLVGGLPSTPSDPRSLRNCRAWIARRINEIEERALTR